MSFVKILFSVRIIIVISAAAAAAAEASMSVPAVNNASLELSEGGPSWNR